MIELINAAKQLIAEQEAFLIFSVALNFFLIWWIARERKSRDRCDGQLLALLDCLARILKHEEPAPQNQGTPFPGRAAEDRAGADRVRDPDLERGNGGD